MTVKADPPPALQTAQRQMYDGAFEAALEYAKEREQFGQPIGKFDAVRDMLVAMDRKIERARLLTHKAATMYDDGEDVTRISSMAKLDASEIAPGPAPRETEAVELYRFRVEDWTGIKHTGLPPGFEGTPPGADSG